MEFRPLRRFKQAATPQECEELLTSAERGILAVHGENGYPYGLQDELDAILGRRTQRYWVAYLLGIPTLFIYTLVWMANIAEELKAKAIDLGIEGPFTSWWHMFGWNTFGVFLMGPAVATWRFFDTLNKIEQKLNHED